MNNIKACSRKLGVAALVVLVLLAVAYAYSRADRQGGEMSQVSEWRTYEDARYGFSIAYPREWTAGIREGEAGELAYIVFGPASEITLEPPVALKIYRTGSAPAIDTDLETMTVSKNGYDYRLEGTDPVVIAKMAETSKFTK